MFRPLLAHHFLDVQHIERSCRRVLVVGIVGNDGTGSLVVGVGVGDVPAIHGLDLGQMAALDEASDDPADGSAGVWLADFPHNISAVDGNASGPVKALADARGGRHNAAQIRGEGLVGAKSEGTADRAHGRGLGHVDEASIANEIAAEVLVVELREFAFVNTLESGLDLLAALGLGGAKRINGILEILSRRFGGLVLLGL